MRIDILTLFPDTMRAMLGESILGRAQARGLLDIRCHQIRDYTENRQKQVDDYPYGGGWGQVMMAQPLKSCLDAALADSAVPAPRRRVIYLSPQGQTFTQAKARQLKADYDQLVLVCGHYEGVDERFIEACVDEELSIGDFVLTGGELGAGRAVGHRVLHRREPLGGPARVPAVYPSRDVGGAHRARGAAWRQSRRN